MNELESPKSKPRRGRDFLIGFGSATAYVFFMGALVFVVESPMFLQFSVGLLLLALVMLVVKGRPHIAIGIATAVVAVPLLLVGTCFAIIGRSW